MKPKKNEGSTNSTASDAICLSLARSDCKSASRPVVLSFEVRPTPSTLHIRATRMLVASIILLASCAWATPPAVIFNVNDNRDTVDLDAGGLCLTVDGTCTLRAAVMAANHYDEIVQINLPAGVYTLGKPSGSDGDDTGDLNLVSVFNSPYVIIFGAGAANTIIDGNMTDRLLTIETQRQVSMLGVTLRNGKASSVGGAIYNKGSLTLTDVTILTSSAGSGGGLYNVGIAYLTRVAFNRNAASYGGGGVSNEGALTMGESSFDSNTADSGAGLANYPGDDTGSANLSHVTFNANKAVNSGGGILNSTQLTVADSTFNGNEAVVKGGGIINTVGSPLEIDRSTIMGGRAQQGAGIHNSGGMTVLNTTISANASISFGGGIKNDGAMNVFNSTIAFNEADAADLGSTGAGIDNTGTLNLSNSVVAGNYLYGAQDYNDCTGIIGIYGNNKFTGTAGCSAAAGSPGSATYMGSVYELDILKDNGGPTRTVALIPPSTLIDGATGCVDQNNVPLATDQRGRPRAVGAHCDIGAFEYDPGDIFANGFQ